MDIFALLRFDSARAPIPAPDGVTYARWQPSLTRIVPPGAPSVAYAAFWAMHHLRAFANRDYSAVIGTAGGKVVHRLGVFPGSARFPFMRLEDLQIGDVWTDPAHRGRGLAAYGIQFAAGLVTRPGRSLWYITAEDNVASLRVAERCGFVRHARVRRSKPWDVALLGTYDYAIEGDKSEKAPSRS